MTQNYIIAIVGMAGTGKSVISQHLSKRSDFEVVHFGGFTSLELQKRGIPITPDNEKPIREEIRRNLGMAAYAKMGIPFIDEILAKQKHVAVDGMYSLSEYELLREKYKDQLVVIAICAHKHFRTKRLGERPIRPLTPEQIEKRDLDEIKLIEKAGPIALADFTILNNLAMDDLYASVDEALASILSGKDHAGYDPY